MAHTDIPDAQTRIKSRDKDVPWYTNFIGSRLGPSARKLLEDYSHVPADQVESHIYAVRDKAWQIWPYPCIGQFRFLDLGITLSPHFPSLLSRLSTQNQNFLDLGCCFGQDLRAFAAAGAPSQNLYATDLRRDFWELGYELFKDRETLRSRFIEADVLADDGVKEVEEDGGKRGEGLGELDGKIDIVYAGSFLHLFDYAEQFKVCERIVKLLKPVKGSVVLGRKVGYVIAGEKVHRTNHREIMFRHNKESFRKMWEEVGRKTGTSWTVDVELNEVEDRGPNTSRDPDMRRLKFTVFRV